MSKMNLKIISEAHGAIRQILVSYIGGQELHDFILDLIEKLNVHSQIIIWVPMHNQLATLEKAIKKKKVSYHVHRNLKGSFIEDHKDKKCYIIPDQSPGMYAAGRNGMWVQDPFLVKCDKENWPYLFGANSFYAGGLRNEKLSGELSAAKIVRSSERIDWFYFEGGNLLVGDDFILIGENHFDLSLKHIEKHLIKEENGYSLDDKTKIFEEKLKKELGVSNVCSVGNRINIGQDLVLDEGPGVETPFKHLDQYVTLAGRGENGKYILVVAEVEPIDDDMMANETICQLNERLEDVCRQLKEKGFEIKRNPVPYLLDGSFAYYNNCLVEIIDDGEKTVWLPTFDSMKLGLERFTELNVAIWEFLGFKVVLLADMGYFSLRRGAAHCLTKVLSRI